MTKNAGRANILLVDDRPENLVALEAVLEPLDHNLVSAQSGEAALKHLLDQEFSVILLDVQMTGMDGFETAKQIKEREKTRDVPIIFLTAISRDTQHALMGYSTGAVDYIAKPYDPGSLRAKVSVFVELHEKNELLRRQAEELERSNEELQQFAYIASHDLREPLRVMSGFLELLKDGYGGTLDDDAREYIAAALRSAGRMQGLIDALLQYSRVGSGAWSPEPTDMNMVMAQAIDNLGAAIEESEATIEYKDLPIVPANSSLMMQLMQNLIGNALKFSGDKTPLVQVTAAAEDGRWIFEVKDNGIGFDHRQSGRLFEIFQRLHSEAEYAGTGIGLAICKKIVDQHGGRIWCDSRPGTGAAFFFSMPAVTA